MASRLEGQIEINPTNEAYTFSGLFSLLEDNSKYTVLSAYLYVPSHYMKIKHKLGGIVPITGWSSDPYGYAYYDGAMKDEAELALVKWYVEGSHVQDLPIGYYLEVGQQNIWRGHYYYDVGRRKLVVGNVKGGRLSRLNPVGEPLYLESLAALPMIRPSDLRWRQTLEKLPSDINNLIDYPFLP